MATPELILDVHVQPHAAKDESVGCHGDRLEIRITAPPVDSKANQQTIRLLAAMFKVPKRDVIIASALLRRG